MVTLVVAPPGLRTEIGFGQGRRGTQEDRASDPSPSGGGFVVPRPVPSRGAVMSVAQLRCLEGSVPLQCRRSATGYGIEHSAQAPALAAPGQGGPGHERTQQEGPAPPRLKIQWGRSSLPFTRSSLPRSGPGPTSQGTARPGNGTRGSPPPSGMTRRPPVVAREAQGGIRVIRHDVSRCLHRSLFGLQDPMAAGAGRAADPKSRSRIPRSCHRTGGEPTRKMIAVTGTAGSRIIAFFGGP
ncbi:hypothetical protein NDU88_003074 [Pleurodeles waltl]|uniref:Uncharacterized protein n=1 Tax=Pleurodeles waltl TaxID=8319 RepID=A0AAV7W6C5_PLEWA|nr:hypothetical protein NDU88_003074 [Pleurodeles waltl]